ILGPILEEIIFRKILFGYLNEKFNVWIAAFVSSLIFGLVHMEMQTLIVYMDGYGTCFCLYLLENKTNYYTNFSTCFNQFLRCINPACRQCRKVRKNAGRVNDFFESIKKESKYKDVHGLFYNGSVVYVRRF